LEFVSYGWKHWGAARKRKDDAYTRFLIFLLLLIRLLLLIFLLLLILVLLLLLLGFFRFRSVLFGLSRKPARRQKNKNIPVVV